jgi:hypothetical protein
MLVPELAERIAAATAVIFVDARPATDTPSVANRSAAAPIAGLLVMSRALKLLGLAEALSSQRPRSFMVSVPAADFDFRSTLSRRPSALYRKRFASSTS